MSGFTKRALFVAGTAGLLLAGIGPMGNLSLGNAAFAKEAHTIGHSQGDVANGKDRGSHEHTTATGPTTPSPDSSADVAGHDAPSTDSPDGAGDR